MMKLFHAVIAFAGIGAMLAVPTVALAQSSASPYTSATRYDKVGRVVGTIAPDPDGGGGLKHLATRTTYDARGNVIKVETGELSTWRSENIQPKDWGSVFTVHTITETTYDILNRKIIDRVKGSDGWSVGLTQYSYDSVGRLECTAVRMNPAVWSNLPSSACTLGAQGSDGPDRITRTYYDAAGRVLQVRKGVGTPQQISEVTYNYRPNGQIENVVDANGNRAKYIYDAHDRLYRWHFPNKTRPTNWNPNSTSVASSGASTPTWTDYEQYTYDANGNSTRLRKRDGREINYTYDKLNRLIKKDLCASGASCSPISTSHTRDVYYAYDLRGLQTHARFLSHTGRGVVYTYDGFGRVTTDTQNSYHTTLTLTYQYDANGNKTHYRVNGASGAAYAYDGLNRVSQIYNNAALGDPNHLLQTITYNDRGLVQKTAERYGSESNYGYDAVGRLGSLNHDFNNSSNDVTWGYTRNPASQIRTETQSNDSYSWDGHVDLTRNYATNGLNQYIGAGSASFTYDANGNLTSDGNSTYLYDVENRLVKVTRGSRVTELFYDPLGRLYLVTDGSTGSQRFLYDGDEMIGEYTTSGSTQRKHIHGLSAGDDPVWTYDFTQGSNKGRFSHKDPRGSIVAISSYSANVIATNSYDAYGIPDTASGSSNDIATKGRFRYTGQMWLPEIDLYYYKARIYSPTLGRFLQTDPIGYEDQFNLYGYVGNDPINAIDPSGLRCVTSERELTICTPEDSSVEPLSFRQESGWTDFKGGDPNFHKYDYSHSVGSGDAEYGVALEEALIANPTPGKGSATIDGATIDVDFPFGLSGRDDVTSYIVTFKDGSRGVLNVTQENHAVGSGFVVRRVVNDGNGNYSIRTYGEGNSPFQSGWKGTLGGADAAARSVWAQSARKIRSQAYRRVGRSVWD